MQEQEVLEALRAVGAFVTNSHVVYTSGRHGSTYVNKHALFPRTTVTSLLCAALARAFMGDDVHVVIAPKTANPLSQWTAHHLTEFGIREVLAVYADERDGFRPAIAHGYDRLIARARVLVLDDTLNTGGTARAVVEAVRGAGGYVVGFGALCNRGGVAADDVGDVPKLFALCSLSFESWDADDCPLCAVKAQINIEFGKGREFLAHRSRT